jgi:hypothetical protein
MLTVSSGQTVRVVAPFALTAPRTVLLPSSTVCGTALPRPGTIQLNFSNATGRNRWWKRMNRIDNSKTRFINYQKQTRQSSLNFKRAIIWLSSIRIQNFHLFDWKQKRWKWTYVSSLSGSTRRKLGGDDAGHEDLAEHGEWLVFETERKKDVGLLWVWFVNLICKSWCSLDDIGWVDEFVLVEVRDIEYCAWIWILMM